MMTELEREMIAALSRNFALLPITGRYAAGANQQADHVTVSDEQGGVWEIALFSRAAPAVQAQLIRQLARAAEACEISAPDRLGYCSVLDFEVVDSWAGRTPWEPWRLRLLASRHGRPGRVAPEVPAAEGLDRIAS